MAWQPTTDEVRGAWRALVGTTKSFDAWLESTIQEALAEERQRVIDLLDKETRHYASTHYAGKQCQWCDIFLKIEGENK